MLETIDRTIPFYNIILKCDEPTSKAPELPKDYSFRMFSSGDEKEWARLEFEIGDFESLEEAEEYFCGTYLLEDSDICERCVFAVSPDGLIVGACTAWRDKKGVDTVASLHWLVVSPKYQGLGIGKALVRKVMQIFAHFNECPVYIHTQPWSYKAVMLYVREGFKWQRSDTFSHYENQFVQAANVLKDILPYEYYLELEENTHPAIKRCKWVNMKNPLYVDYHDNEWGVPCHDEHDLYELFILESFQAGLSWETVLNKRENFCTAYDGFDIDKVSAYDEEKINKLMNDSGIVRNRRKIEASIRNSRIYKDICEEYGSFDKFIWGFTNGKTIVERDPAITTSLLSDNISKFLKKRGMTFVGSTIIYSYLQAIGVINAHAPWCCMAITYGGKNNE